MEAVRKKLTEKNATALIVSALDEVACESIAIQSRNRSYITSFNSQSALLSRTYLLDWYQCSLETPTYCRVPARRGLQQTGRAATRHGASDLMHVKHLTIDKLDNYLDKNFKKKPIAYLIRLFLLRQGEPGTSQYH